MLSLCRCCDGDACS